MIWIALFIGCKGNTSEEPEGWFSLDQFHWEDSGIAGEANQSNLWIASGNAEPFSRMTGSFTIERDRCSLAFRIIESSVLECPQCHFAFRLGLELESGESNQCEDFPRDWTFANSNTLDLGFWGREVLLYKEDWVSIEDSIFEHNLDSGDFTMQFPSWD